MKNIYWQRLFDENTKHVKNVEKRSDMPGDLQLALDHRDEDVYGVFEADTLVGIALICPGEEAFISLYMMPEYRGRGIAGFVLKEWEEMLRQEGTTQIVTAYAKEFSGFMQKRGYQRQFSSAYMKYAGEQYEVDTSPVRQYQDADYHTVQAFHAKAFHEMRLQVGDFPDSVQEQPSEEERQEWAATKEDRLVYVKDSRVVAYANVDGCELDGISVAPEQQGQGIGKQFAKCVCNYILDQGYSEISLFCVVGNKARRMYDQLGFKEVVVNEYGRKLLG